MALRYLHKPYNAHHPQNYVRSLRFDDKPDYPVLRQRFRDLLAKEGKECDYVFDWTIKRIQECVYAEESLRRESRKKVCPQRASALLHRTPPTCRHKVVRQLPQPTPRKAKGLSEKRGRRRNVPH